MQRLLHALTCDSLSFYLFSTTGGGCILRRKKLMRKRAELLAPAGSFESMTAAVNAGADAVYMGGSQFGARAYAENPDTEKMIEALDFCHLHGVKLYMTVNTLLKEQEMEKLYDFLAPFYEHGLDAAIVQDFGVLRYLKRQFPDLDLHASTQMTDQSADGAAILEAFGVTRVVTSRELTLPEIRKIHEKTDLEIESFVHGALCYSYSGQCLLSSMIGGRSGNRGRCAQPCRLPWHFSEKAKGAGEYLLSPKDICTLKLLPEILDAGVYSLKIEGRMKRPEYTAGVTRIYRKYLDLLQEKGAKHYQVEEDDIRELMDLYNRGGFSEGYYKTKGNAGMMSTFRQNHFGTKGARVLAVRKNLITARALEELHKGDVLESATMNAEIPSGKEFQMKAGRDMRVAPGDILHRTQNAALLTELSAYQNFGFRKEKLNGKLRISLGKPAILSLNWCGISLEVSGASAEPAQRSALTQAEAEKQLRKTGNTEFTFERLDIELDEGCFLPVQALKELRREGLFRLSEARIRSCHRNVPEKLAPEAFSGEKETALQLSVLVSDIRQAEGLLTQDGIRRFYLESDLLLEDPEAFLRLRKNIQHQGKECFLAMPPLFREDKKGLFQAGEAERELPFMDGFLVRNLEELAYLKEQTPGAVFIADANLYSWNQEARSFLKEQGFSGDTAPLELNSQELSERGLAGSELVVYGRAPLMLSSQCVKRTTGNCNKKKEFTFLTDRKGKTFPVWNDCSVCMNIIYNTAPLDLSDQEKEIRTLAPAGIRLTFTTETAEEAKKITEVYIQRFLLGEAASLTLPEFTRGHFKRGVE